MEGALKSSFWDSLRLASHSDERFRRNRLHISSSYFGFISVAELASDHQERSDLPPLENCGFDGSQKQFYREAQCGTHPSVHGI